MIDFTPRFSPRLVYAVLAISLFLGYLSENIQKRHRLSSDARKLATVISEPIDFISTLSIHMGRQIIDNNKQEDLHYIDNLFKETVRLQGSANNVISWSMFSWGDKKHRLMVNTVAGVTTKEPENLVDRNYTWRARYEPWMLQFARPDIGRVSKTLILPSAVGLSNIRDEFQGTIITGINIKALTNRAEAVLRSGNAFILANRDTFNQDADKIILTSSNAPKLARAYSKIPELVDKCKDWIDPAGAMPTTIKAGRFKFAYYRILEGYPLVIFVGFNRLEFWGNVLWKSVIASMLISAGLYALYLRRGRKDV